LDTLPPATRDAFLADLGLAHEKSRASVVPKRATAQDGHWDTWCEFCREFNLEPTLADLPDPVPILQVFATRLRDGRIAPSKNSIRSRSVEDYVRTVGQEIASLGSSDPRVDAGGNITRRIRTLLAAYKKEDPPSDRVKPIPIQLVQHAVETAYNTQDPLCRATADCGVIGFFFLLRPGEHTKSYADNHPFRLQDVSFYCDDRWLNAAVAPLPRLLTATSVLMNFTTQKNGEENEAVKHGDTDSILVSPLRAVRRRVQHLRQWNADPATPLHTVYLAANKQKHVTAGALTNMLRKSCTVLGPTLGIRAKDISARALRAGGAMALLRANVDPTVIQLVGRWKSWAMIQYLHKSATETNDLAARMVIGGNYSLTTHAVLPQDTVDWLAAVGHPVAA
jgi:hypothetical protein